MALEKNPLFSHHHSRSISNNWIIYKLLQLETDGVWQDEERGRNCFCRYAGWFHFSFWWHEIQNVKHQNKFHILNVTMFFKVRLQNVIYEKLGVSLKDKMIMLYVIKGQSKISDNIWIFSVLNNVSASLLINSLSTASQN